MASYIVKRFLKEFFEVSVIMENRADPQFILADNHVRLDLPTGLSFAPTFVPQQPEQHIETIAGDESESVSWIVLPPVA